jgi:hypothetical protein
MEFWAILFEEGGMDNLVELPEKVDGRNITKERGRACKSYSKKASS